LKRLLQQLHPVDVLAQAPAHVGSQTRLALHQQGAAHALFQQPDALRNC
jgi:hypothetical protein